MNLQKAPSRKESWVSPHVRYLKVLFIWSSLGPLYMIYKSYFLGSAMNLSNLIAIIMLAYCFHHLLLTILGYHNNQIMELSPISLPTVEKNAKTALLFLRFSSPIIYLTG